MKEIDVLEFPSNFGMGKAANLALVLVFALIFGLIGSVSNVDAVQVAYTLQLDSGTSLGGLSTNWSAPCGTSPTADSAMISLMNQSATGCSSASSFISFTDTGSAATPMLLVISDTAYSQATTLTGVEVLIGLRQLTAAADFRFELGYLSGGFFTPLGSYVFSGSTTAAAGYSVSLSSISGTAPAGSYLALRVSSVNGDGTNDIQIFANFPSFETILAVDEVAISPPWSDSALLHNSNRFAGTVKHGGTWGQPGSYAGGFTCNTCHVRNSTNIKRIKAEISFPDGSSMPNGAASSSVVLQTVEDGSSDFGDDSTAPRSSSAKVCEVCHSYDATQVSGVKQHAADQSIAVGHYDNSDCIKCHQHRAGFMADCTSCHGTPPVDASGLNPGNLTGSTTAGKHQLHAVDKGYGCNTCHSGWEASGQMPNVGNINIGFVTSGADGGIYEGRPSIGGTYTGDSLTGTTVTQDTPATDMSCAVYCHGYGTPTWEAAATAACGSCHGEVGQDLVAGTTDDAGAPLGGTSYTLSGLNEVEKVGKHTNHLDNSIEETGDPCALCHFATLYADSTHVDGTVNVQLRQAASTQDGSGGGAGLAATYSGGSCSSLDCHGDAPWDSSATGGCNFCHGYPPTSSADPANNRHVSGATPVNHDIRGDGVTSGITGTHSDCLTCHGKNSAGLADNSAAGGDAYLASYHIDTNNEMNGWSSDSGQDAQYQESGTGAYGCAKACHANDVDHQLSDSGLNVQLHRYGSNQCTSCHEDGINGAPMVKSTSATHLATTLGGSFNACEDCHSGHVGSGGVIIELPSDNWINAGGETHVTGNMQTALGIDYTDHNGINLGGPGTVASINSKITEAEICWGCHDAAGIGELHTNAGATYKFGVLSTSLSTADHVSDWTTPNAWRIDAYDTRLTRPIASIHTVNMNGTLGHSSSVADNVVGGRVKRGGLNTSLPGNAKDQGDGAAPALEDKQYIRCSYCHDVHSLNRAIGDTGATAPYLRGTWRSDPYDADVPPSGNYNWPANYFYSLQTNGMPRVKVESTGKGYYIDQNSGNPTSGETLDSSAGLCTLCHGPEVDNMDYYTDRKLWRTINGHSNSTLGGSGTNKADLFDARRGRSSYYMAMQDQVGVDLQIDEVVASSTLPWGAQMYQNNRIRTSGWYGGTLEPGDYANWYAAGRIGSHTGIAGGKAHDFSCSKCHSPHATGLPALLKTNCLDVQLGAWTNSSVAAVNYNTAQSTNCHRKTATSDGWHSLAPKQ
jgi:hypothetical protein